MPDVVPKRFLAIPSWYWSGHFYV